MWCRGSCPSTSSASSPSRTPGSPAERCSAGSGDERQPPAGLGQQQLHVADVTLEEGRFAVAEVEGPQPLPLRIETRRLQPPTARRRVDGDLPPTQRLGVVAPDVLEVDDDEIGRPAY